MNLIDNRTHTPRPRQAVDVANRTTVEYGVAQAELGCVLIAPSVGGVCAILIGADAEQLERDLADRFPGRALNRNEAGLRTELAKVLRFIDNPGEGMDLPLALRGTTLQRRVWQALRAIPAGTTITYAELAVRVGAPTSARAVANACAANVIALAIPCHRVVRSSGELAGYRWGIERKRTLIAKEAML